MKHAPRGFTALALIGLVAAGCALAAGPKSAPAPKSAPTANPAALDWFVMDVCLDGSGKVMPGVSPLDAACTKHRDLQIGEPLPYHEQDYSPSERHTRTRSDAFPTRTAFGIAAVHTEDSVGAFGHYDEGDGAQVLAFSDAAAAWVLTNGHQGIRAYMGPRCGSYAPADARGSLDSWIIANLTSSGDLQPSGETIAQLNRATNTKELGGKCHKLVKARTVWRMTEYSYMTGFDPDKRSAPLKTLISTHGGVTDIHAERNYFTRELGRVRWEQWNNLDKVGKSGKDAAEEKEKSEKVLARQFCKPLEGPPSSKGHWVMSGCRENTNIVKADSASGFDPPPLDFLAPLKQSPVTKSVFAAP